MIYFCIPAHNEERTVGVVLWKLRQVMGELQRDYQIIVVDDASTDGTRDVLSPYTRVLPLSVIRNDERRGYAASLELSLREALRRAPYPKRDAVITLQADFTEDPDYGPALIKRIEAGADVVCTNATFDAATPRRIRWAHDFFRRLLRKHTWAQIGDPLCGLRAYRVITLKRAVEKAAGDRLVTWDGWAANAELLAAALPHSRRNDVIDITIRSQRMQRPTRFRMLPALRQVMAVAQGKSARGAQPVLAGTPMPLHTVPVLELVPDIGPDTRQQRRSRPHEARRRGSERKRTDSKANGRAQGTERKLTVHTNSRDQEAARPSRRKRKRSRRRGSAGAQPQAAETGIAPVQAAAMPTEAAAPDAIVNEEATAGAPQQSEPRRKKSRRGRRGGRGRRRGARPSNGEEKTITPDSVPSDIPPRAAEGD